MTIVTINDFGANGYLKRTYNPVVLDRNFQRLNKGLEEKTYDDTNNGGALAMAIAGSLALGTLFITSTNTGKEIMEYLGDNLRETGVHQKVYRNFQNYR